MKYKKLIAKMITNNDNDNLCFVLLYLCVVQIRQRLTTLGQAI